MSKVNLKKPDLINLISGTSLLHCTKCKKKKKRKIIHKAKKHFFWGGGGKITCDMYRENDQNWSQAHLEEEKVSYGFS